MWIRITRQFKSIGYTGVINQTLEVESFPTKEKAIPKGAVVSKMFGEPIYEKGDLYYEVVESESSTLKTP